MRGLLFLLSVLFLLESTKGTEYDKLDDHDKKIVDKAIKQGNKDQGKGKHLDYYNIVKTHNNLINVILRPTSCDGTTPRLHQKECKTLDKKPQVSCIDCNGTMEPCLLLRQKEEIIKRMNKCQSPPSVISRDSHIAGGSHLLFQKGGNEQQQIGCIGCI